MYVYIQTEKPGWFPNAEDREDQTILRVYLTRNLWTVGHYAPGGCFIPESDHESAESAAERVHYLNGGLKT